jgi:beta-lactamase regulating signal transducer with metallopeptidase domain
MDFASLQHSIFLQALGSAILNSLWQGFILWLLFETISLSYKTSSARFKNNLSTLLLFVSFTWFITSFVTKIINHATVILPDAGPILISGQSHNASTSQLQEFLNYAASSLPYLSVAYIFLLLFLVAKLFAAYRYVYIISNKRLVTAPAMLQVFTAKVAQQMKISRKIAVWISHHIDVPATIGFIKPIILIPFASLNNLSEDQLEAIILHELAHIRRNDYLINIVISAIETVLFFNPFVVLLSKVIKRERENCCDDFVLQYRYDPHSYASALLSLERSRTSSLRLAVGAVSGKNQLLSRIKRITNGQAAVKQFNYLHKLLALLLVTGIICFVAWLSPAEQRPFSDKASIKEIVHLPLPTVSHVANTSTAIANLSENLPVKILKEIFSKKDENLVRDDDTQNFTSPNVDLSNDDEDNNDFSPSTDDKKGFITSLNLNAKKFFFDESKLKLPAAINIKNFPFKNMSFNIDLSKIDLTKMNKNLEQAYKEINAIDWKKIQNGIEQNFSNAKMNNLLSKKQLQSYIKKAKDLSELEQNRQQLKLNRDEENFKTEINLRDSINLVAMNLVYKNNTKIQQQYNVLQNLYQENPEIKTYLNCLKSVGRDNENSILIRGNNDLYAPKRENVMISRKAAGKPNKIRHEKKIFQFSFDTNDKNQGTSKVINVEVSDLP